MAEIKRLGASRLSATRGSGVSYNGVVTTVATAVNKTPSLYDQAKDALSVIDRQLVAAGTSKARILTVICYIADMKRKPELNKAWDEWVDRNNLPMRACLEVGLEGDDLVELIVTAAV